MPPPCRRLIIQRTGNDHTRFIERVGVDHCRGHIFVTQQLLHGANIISILQQMCSETVPKGVAACRLRDSGALDRGFHCFLKVFLRYVVTTRLARARVDGNFRGWENVLPSPGAIGVAVFSFERERQINPDAAVADRVGEFPARAPGGAEGGGANARAKL